MRLLATLAAFLFSGIVLATPLHNIVVFGDSLSDNGNLYEFMNQQLPPSPPYFKGRFSNGLVWVEHLAASYFPKDPGAHLLDYAYGGAGVSSDEEDDDVLFTLRREVKDYLASHQNKASADSLYVVWIGSNNYLALPTEVDKTLRDVNEGITESLQRLADKGAKHILVVNIPDLGSTPAAIEFDAIETMSYFSQEHNSLLNNTLVNLKQKYPDVEWLFFDMNQSFNDVVANPQVYGFNNINGSCIDLINDNFAKKSVLNLVRAAKPQQMKRDACDGYLFFDLVHPTALAHELLADKAKKALDEAGVTFTE
ncbi:SGNH/GDSL hydrolase family protein [Legionella lytica]|uniref:SGNH/GDSL hydrolase family protein n=1 Tax=Legionella lytica TaxID=96232 RepID=A0ABY4YA68_9GAMM|nr:SGNH/GDSL hydrolase family protein [Legionella lytica]USQ14553.1 SGNH/GDSL hydrolase family protein [Legionella lytica]